MIAVCTLSRFHKWLC